MSNTSYTKTNNEVAVITNGIKIYIKIPTPTTKNNIKK